MYESTYYAPDDKGYFKVMREAEDGETEEGKHTCFWREKKKLLRNETTDVTGR